MKNTIKDLMIVLGTFAVAILWLMYIVANGYMM